MCGIAGYLSAVQLPGQALERMTERLRHRGPMRATITATERSRSDTGGSR